MYTNRLQLNPDKTDFMFTDKKSHRNKFYSNFLFIFSRSKFPPPPPPPPIAHAKYLGVYIDFDLNLQHHIENTAKMCKYFIRDIRCVRKHLNSDVSTALANALVSSRLDYCNYLLNYIPKVLIDKLHRVQSSLARVVTKYTSFTSSKPLLDRLHRLPIASRINFKIATLTYKAVHLKQPSPLPKHLKLLTLCSTVLETMINCFFNIVQLVLTVMDVVPSDIRRPQFEIIFQTIFVIHHQ